MSPGRISLEFLFDVDVFVELVDQVVADRFADRRVLDQAAAGVDPVVGVERLALGPDREDAEEGEDRAEHDEDSDHASSSAAHRADAIRDAMKLEGIHHITAITADAQSNVDFYAGSLGLRLVKKTVNQDNPTVYHLFFADEKGSAGSDLTFFEFPGVPAGPGRRRRWSTGSSGGSPRTRRSTSGRSGSAANGIESERGGGEPALRRPRGPRARAAPSVEVADEPLIADHPEVPAELALQGFHAVRAYSARPDASDAPARGARVRAASTRAWEARGDQRGGLYVYDEPPAERVAAGRRQRPPRRLGLDDRRARGVARAGDRGRRPRRPR